MLLRRSKKFEYLFCFWYVSNNIEILVTEKDVWNINYDKQPVYIATSC
jgi:hypothetical protein